MDAPVLTLKRIDILGFKSFCNRERLRFSGRGVAAVVGPNGCGKSNICDAVNWVLGEQSAKSLRGSRMHDVIFNGTKHRAPAGLATVTLTLHLPSDTLPGVFGIGNTHGSGNGPPVTASGEVAVTRKLFRNGTSQYILNGKVVRLRDVQNLFLGTGLGPNHYAIIEQGQIGQFLNARSIDRRAFVEEAAGVTRYKVSRRLAQRRLASASQNLERVHDILAEIRRQATSLHRQARRAEKYERLQAEHRGALKRVFAYRFHRIEGGRVRLLEEVEAASARLSRLAGEADRLEAEFAEKRTREQSWQFQLEGAREKLAERRVEAERIRERVAQQSQAIARNAGREERSRRDLEAAGARLLRFEEAAAEERTKVKAQEAATVLLQGRLQEMSQEYADRKADLAEVFASKERCRRSLLENLNEIYRERASVAKLDQALGTHSGLLKQARGRQADASERLAPATEQLRRHQSMAEHLSARFGEETARCEALELDVKRRGAKLASLQESLSDQRGTLLLLDARKRSLTEALADRVHAGTAVEEILTVSREKRVHGFEPLGVLADFLEVDAGCERAVEQFLGEDLSYLVVCDWRQAGRGVELVRDEFGGRVAFLFGSEFESTPRQMDPGSDRVRPLAELVRLDLLRPGSRFGLPPKLSDGYMVESAEAARRLAGCNPNSYFLLPDGTWYHRNTVHVGRDDSCGPLVLKQQLRELGPQLNQGRKRLLSIESSIAVESEALRGAREALEKAWKHLRALKHEHSAAENSERRAALLVEDLRSTIAKAGEEKDRLISVRARTQRNREQSQARQSQLESEYARLEASEAEIARKSGDGQAELSRLENKKSALQAEAAALAERLRASIASSRLTDASVADHRNRIAESERQIERWMLESEQLAASNRELGARSEESEGRQGELQLRIEALSGDLNKSRATTMALVDSIREHRSRVEAVRRACSDKQVALARAQSDLEHVVRDCASELGEDVAEVAEAVPPESDSVELATAEQLARKIKARIRRLGPVNVLAQKEHAEIVQRQEFLEAHQQDLIEAIANTQVAIRKIDEESQERFEAAFHAINANFKQVFATLFEGGVGEMRLVELEAFDEAGIEVVAQPPGKRLQNVALLSGGEKSLTVMAILMATFLYKPSPFCILDEVDSQLDETNTVRLRRLLKRMAQETQFILITHSRTMMEAAETLYGVTMGEAGVSTLVSVRMNEFAAEDAVSRPTELASASARL